MNIQKGQWVGVDFDGTLAYYDHWRGKNHLGKPIPLMIQRVRNMIARGITVKVFTARAYMATQQEIDAIKAWCLEHVGQELEVTCIKDQGMVQLYCDRAVQVVANTGKIIYLKKDKIK
jgi:hypothetical protein